MAAPEVILPGEELSVLLSEKGNTCISIIVPLVMYGPEREQNKRLIDRSIQRAKEWWDQLKPDRSADGWISRLLHLKEQLDPIHPPQSIGFFLSENLQRVIAFTFITKEKIVIGNSFEVRDLLKKMQYEQPYLLLTLSLQKAQLFQGQFTRLTPFTQTGLSGVFKEAFEYARPARSTSYAGQAHVKSFEKEKQDMIIERAAHHFKAVDEVVRKYHTQPTPLVVMADQKLLSLYKGLCSLSKEQLIWVEKDPSHLRPDQLSAHCWPRVHTHFESKISNQIAKFNEAVGRGQTREGLQASWRAAQEGNCLMLLVDESFHAPGFIIESEPSHLFRKPPVEDHRILTDAVDDLIELVLEKNGQVLMAEPESLPEGRKIMLITRY
jgi:hypothetical protein